MPHRHLSRPDGDAVFVSGLVVLFLIRPTFVWIIVVPACFVPMVMVPPGHRTRALAVASIGAVAVLGVQIHDVAVFGQWTTSSWTSENLIGALLRSGAVSQRDVLRAAGSDRCLQSLARDPVFWGSVSAYDPSCFGAHQDLAHRALVLDGDTKDDNGYIQFNSLARLDLAEHWNTLALKVLVRHPLAVWSMAWGGTRYRSSWEISMSPAFSFPDVGANLAAGAPLTSLGRPLGVVFPGVAATLVATGLVLVWRRRRHLTHRDRVMVITAVTLGYCVVLGTLLEWGENARFMAEAYPLLVIGAVVALAMIADQLGFGASARRAGVLASGAALGAGDPAAGSDISAPASE